MTLQALGIIAGKGSLPIELFEAYKSSGGECTLIYLSENQLINDELSDQNDHLTFSLGQIGKIIDYLKTKQIKQLVFAGSIKRPNFSHLKLDFTGSMLVAQILKNKFLGDDKLLTIIVNFIEKKGFTIISPLDILVNQNKTFSTLVKPSKQNKQDIEMGVKICTHIGSLDIGQAVIIEKNYTLGVEAAEGTDALIARCADLRKSKNGGVLVKLIKPCQDKRLDIPTIGLNTIENLYKYKYTGIAISNNGVIVLSPKLTFELANKYGLFIELV